jgi:hypothetical protein
MFAPTIFSHINEFRSAIRIFLTRTGVSRYRTYRERQRLATPADGETSAGSLCGSRWYAFRRHLIIGQHPFDSPEVLTI